MFLVLTQFDAPMSVGTHGFHRLSMDLSKCKNSANIGENMPQWRAGTCQTAGYTQPYMQKHVLAGFTEKVWVKPSFSASSLAHYKIPAWADPHYSSSGNDRNYG
uniref:Uncharacterized protein n=1 Tax=Cryptomonas curvata TaxID=233186 RepID=A0A7S0QI50_9CRYP|mmetsp:Transcript_30325/g.63461  ORF Transcript_30325/g.63461 Transcript_30325/m.63461 type:complete len:104 (+) Transcript_30325:20-331(+)